MTSPRTGGGSIVCSSRYIPASNHGTRPTGRSPEMAHPFELTHESQVDATPEGVWEAIATGPGVDAWFMGRNEVEPREGGTTRMMLRGSTEEATVTAWEIFHAGLGLPGPVQVGDRVRLMPEGLPQLEGEVDWLSRDFLGVRTADGIYRFMHISVFGGPTGVGHHIFVDGFDQAETERAWGAWLNGLFA